MFIIVLGQHVSILIESSSGPSKKMDPYLEMLKCAVGSHMLTFVIKLCIKCMCRHVAQTSISINNALLKKVIPKYANLKFTNSSPVSQGTQQHKHFIHSFIKNVSVWDPTAN